MDIYQIKKYWGTNKEKLVTYKHSQLDNSRLLSSTIDFLINCGLPKHNAPSLFFDEWEYAIPTPNQVLRIDFEELDDYLMIGSNGCGDPVCIDLNDDDAIVYLNHDNYFERVYINNSILQLAESIIQYSTFHASLIKGFESNNFIKRKFTDDEFSEVCNDFQQIDDKCMEYSGFWKPELDYLIWERDNE